MTSYFFALTKSFDINVNSWDIQIPPTQTANVLTQDVEFQLDIYVREHGDFHRLAP